MVYLVPFDGSTVAETALSRAVEYGRAMNETVVAVGIVPTGDGYAIRRRKVAPDEDFAARTAAQDLRRKIEEATDEAEFHYENESAVMLNDGVTERLQQTAADLDATVIFLGAEGGDGAADLLANTTDDADVHVVRSIS
jgi:nucleotide-binding universal stress UspA family protein